VVILVAGDQHIITGTQDLFEPVLRVPDILLGGVLDEVAVQIMHERLRAGRGMADGGVLVEQVRGVAGDCGRGAHTLAQTIADVVKGPSGVASADPGMSGTGHFPFGVIPPSPVGGTGSKRTARGGDRRALTEVVHDVSVAAHRIDQPRRLGYLLEDITKQVASLTRFVRKRQVEKHRSTLPNGCQGRILDGGGTVY
jgi:hypothetical protein